MTLKEALTDPAADSSVAEPLDGEKPMRADARRNRERLITAALEVFAEQGANASMEAIAKHAGVGVGTLYRHFPTRMDVVEAVYENDVEELSEAARRVNAELGPWPAVEAFFDAFLRYARTKQVLLTELHQAFEKNPDLKSRCRSMIESAFDLVIDRAKEAGVVRTDVYGADLTQLVSPICTNAAISTEQTRRLLNMILDGLRASAQTSA
jgi:AcrR family transcriptional regulator